MDQLLRIARLAYWGSLGTSAFLSIGSMVLLDGGSGVSAVTQVNPLLLCAITLLWVAMVADVQVRLIKQLRRQDQQAAS